VFSLVEAGDSNGDRRLDFDEFLDMMTAKLVSWARGGGGYRMG
jgi:Ca2+-binding EF-hand superfamily protein